MSKFFTSLENMDPNSSYSGDPSENAQQIIETTNEVADRVAATESDLAVIEKTHDVVEDGLNSAETLTDVGVQMQDSLDNGEGMSEETAKMAEVAKESVSRILGLPKRYIKVPSVENYRRVSGRQTSTIAALEGIVDGIKNLFSKIADFLKNIWNKIKEFFMNLFNSYESIKKNLTSIEDSLKNKKDELDNKELDKSSLAKFFTIKDEEATVANVSTVISTAAGLLDSSSGLTAKTKDIAAKLAGLVGKDKDEEVKAIADEVTTSIKEFVSVGSSSVDGDTTKYGPLPGYTYLEVTSKEYETTIDFTDGKKPAKKIAAADMAGIKRIISEAKSLCDGGEKAKKTMKDSDAANKGLVSICEKISSTLGKDNGEQKALESYKHVGKVVNSLSKIYSKASTKLPAIHMQTCKAAAEYASACASNLKNKDKDK